MVLQSLRTSHLPFQLSLSLSLSPPPNPGHTPVWQHAMTALPPALPLPPRSLRTSPTCPWPARLSTGAVAVAVAAAGSTPAPGAPLAAPRWPARAVSPPASQSLHSTRYVTQDTLQTSLLDTIPLSPPDLTPYLFLFPSLPCTVDADCVLLRDGSQQHILPPRHVSAGVRGRSFRRPHWRRHRSSLVKDAGLLGVGVGVGIGKPEHTNEDDIHVA